MADAGAGGGIRRGLTGVALIAALVIVGTLPPARAQAAAEAVPDVQLSGALMYQLMAAELAAQRGDFPTAQAIYMKLARETRDPRLARRAAELALQARTIPQALEAAQLWHELSPSPEAAQALAMLYALGGRFDEAYPLLRDLLGRSPRAADELGRLQRTLARSADRSGAFSLLERLAEPYMKVPEVRLVLASGAQAAGMAARAASEARAAADLAPDDERTLLAASQFLQSSDRPAARSLLESYLQRHPAASNVRLAYARSLIADNKFDAARAEFERLLRADPDNADLVYSMALLSLQGNLRTDARTHLQRYLTLVKDRDEGSRADAAYLYLAQIAEDEKHYADALQWLRRIERGEEYLTARTREALLLGKMNRVDEGRELLQRLSPESAEEKTQLVVVEAQLLREARRYDESYGLLSQALEQSPDNTALLYEVAMAAEKLDKIDIVEQRLRRLIELRPEHAHAHNALGYTFADRNVRLAEALMLIEKAHQLAPDDAYILDSMGWVHYRLGNLKPAREYLERAYALKPDPEVALHLAEVLWAAGEREAARKLLREVRAKEPGNEQLKSTLSRLQIAL